MNTKPLFSSRLPCLAASLLLSWVAVAQTEFSKTESEPKPEATPLAPVAADQNWIAATGTVFSIEPEVLSVVLKDNATPVRFAYARTTPFVDEAGVVVPMDLIRPELPLTVQYSTVGEKLIAQKVVVTRRMVAGDAEGKPGVKREELAELKAQQNKEAQEAQWSGPQTLIGTVSTVEQTISVVLRGETRPTLCILNNSTRYINIAGQPVSSSLVVSGMPVTVNTVHDGNRVIALEVIVRGNPATLSSENSAALASGKPPAPAKKPVPPAPPAGSPSN